jgi:hypothetical protein
VIAIFLLLLFSIDPPKRSAFSPKDDYLWIEFGERIKEKDGSLTLPLEINYGRFPNNRKGDWQLDALRAFYTLTEKDDKGNRIFYEAEIEKAKGVYLVRIKSFKTDRFIVLIEGRRTQDEAAHYYLAKTSFVLFGHSPLERKKIKPAPSTEINRQFEISIAPEFSGWPQTCNPVRIVPSFNQHQLGEKAVSISDENQDPIEVKTDEGGNYTYIPPDDKKLNWKGTRAFKQTVIVAEETRGNTNYVSSHTLLLHRNRFKNRSPVLGAGIFWGSVAGILLLVVAKRKRFEV